MAAQGGPDQEGACYRGVLHLQFPPRTVGSELKSQQGERGDLRVKAGCKIACRQENEQESLEMKTILGGEEAENSQNGVTEWKRRMKRRRKNRQRGSGKRSDHYVTELTQGETSGKRIGPLPHKKKRKERKRE